MGRTESVIDVNVREFCQFLRKSRVVGLLFVIVPDVFQKQDVPGLHHANSLLHFFSDAVVQEGHGALKHFCEAHRHWPEGHRWLAFAFWPAQVCRQNHFCSAFDQQTKRWQSLDNPRLASRGNHTDGLARHRLVARHTVQKPPLNLADGLARDSEDVAVAQPRFKGADHPG